MVRKTYLDYEATGHFSKVVLDYLRGSAFLRNFYSLAPSPESVSATARQRSRQHYDRQTLFQALTQQHHKLFAELNLPAVAQNIDRLAEPNTVTITTAHQPALFLGPLFVIYKIVACIKAAGLMNARNDGHYYVPVFWMGSEDHDKNELNHIHLFGRTYTWNTAQEGAFGRMSTSSLRPWLQEIKNQLGSSAAASDLAQALDHAYQREKTIAAATRRLLYHLFGNYGLVVIDGDDAALKRLFVPIMEKELTEQFAHRELSQANEKFSIHYTPQIVPREINLFFLGESARERITREGQNFRMEESDVVLTREQLLQLLHNHPEQFSPNVVLRPLYQETILPDAAVIGGGSELTYWLQLSPLFHAVQQHPPVILLRNSLLWIDPVNAERLQKARLTETELFLRTDDLINKFLELHSGEQISLSQQMEKLHAVFDQTLQKISELDPSLRGALESERMRTIKQFEQFEERLRRAAKRKEESSLQQIRTLREKLFPADGLQERYDNFMGIYSRLGSAFIDTLLEHINPFDFRFLILTEPSGSA